MTKSLHKHYKSQENEHQKRWVFGHPPTTGEMVWMWHGTTASSRYEHRQSKKNSIADSWHPCTVDRQRWHRHWL